ncbi:futalosine hydrolase [Streptomyces sp. 6N223]|uniref:futalosine hydrolase n=1 Tax=Streptomyces sp. 6N223 TaxID=3457412 RepID=UPI003FD003EA
MTARVLVVTAVEAERDAVLAGARAAGAANAAAVVDADGADATDAAAACASRAAGVGGGGGVGVGPVAPGTPGADTGTDGAGPPGTGTGADGEAVQPVALPGGRQLYRTAAFDVLVGGVGPAAAAAATATALAMGPEALERKPWGTARARTPGGPGAEPRCGAPGYDLVVSAGIAGGFAGVAGVEAVVVASAIIAADLGVRTGEGFTDIAQLGFGRVAYETPAPLARAAAAAADAVLGPVLTVSCVTGTDERAAELAALHPGAAAEAMEGAGVAEAAAGFGVPVVEIRAVSNTVGTRDRSAWRIPGALAALTAAFARITPVIPALLEEPDHG